MRTIAFIDSEIEISSGKILDLGGIKENGGLLHSNSVSEFVNFLDGTKFLCGHNIIHHDMKYLRNVFNDVGFNDVEMIDTLFLSPLLFPAKPYHALLKDDKLQTDEINNPLNDAMKAKDLFFDEVTAFQRLDYSLQHIFCALLKDKKEFCSFFRFVGLVDMMEDDSNINSGNCYNVENEIRERFIAKICERANLARIIAEQPIELAYCLALINTQSRYSITPPWVLKNFPAVERVMFLLRHNPCLMGCVYCDEAMDIYKGLHRFFGYDTYRTFDGEPLQEKAVNAAIMNKSILVIFPTGGGKSITFQVPALMSGENAKGLTVVLSPLQSLMKDQVDNLEKAGITEAVTINGLLDPIERAKSFERVENGSASLLYISPESLRSRSIERLLLGRNIVRFVIDEAHCFSSWGQDFRVDYLYIGDFIKSLQEKKNLEDPIPVSCFTATAKQKVIEDIRGYFQEKLGLELDAFSTNVSRTNLHYKVFQKGSEEEKYYTIRDLLDERQCPTIIYVQRTGKAYDLAKRLTEDGYEAKPYHGKMDKQEKAENQDAFMRGEVQIMVATSAFGMGVDKKDVGLVIHYEISDSLENYVQEAGRAGRDESISADCYVLYDEEDLNKHFILLNQTKLSIREIQQAWRAIKGLTWSRSRVSQSAFEIARKAGWDDTIYDLETRVKTAIMALEESGYVKRGYNSPRLYANSILVRYANDAIEKINASDKYDEKEKTNAIRVIKKLISSKNRKSLQDEEAESRIDYISDHLGIPREEVIHAVNLLREEKIIGDAKDLIAFPPREQNFGHSLSILKQYVQIESFLLTVLEDGEKTFHIKELNEQAEEYGCEDVTPHKLNTIFNFWVIKNWVKRQRLDYAKNHIAVFCLQKRDFFEENLNLRYELAKFILEYLSGVSTTNNGHNVVPAKGGPVDFSVLEIKEQFENGLMLFKKKATIEDIQDALFYLSKIDALTIEGGFMVIYNAMNIERIEQDNKKRYKVEDYQKLDQFYQNKVQQIHIVGEYATKMLNDYKDALQFVDDYFHLNYVPFLHKYFPGSRQNEIRRNITPAKYRQLFEELSQPQLNIINDKESKYIVVAAGPGSGKTCILVHKLASLVMMEDVKSEQLLMLTFSRAAASEFKKRLFKLIKNAAHFLEIKTFHSYCFDILGKVGTIEKSDGIIREAVKKITAREVEASMIAKTVLVIDEAQDMDADEYALIKALMEWNEEMRVIAVGDDDQNIYAFRGSSSEYLEKLITEEHAVKYELVENWRSKRNIVDFANQFVTKITHRLKDTPNVAKQNENGKIKVVHYKSDNLITPLVNDLLSEGLTGSTCVLTKANEEALQITSLLVEKGVPTKLIQSNEGFNPYNLLEVRFFLGQLDLEEGSYTISDEGWANTKRRIIERFGIGLNAELCLNMIKAFEVTNPKIKHRSDLEIFIRESRLEDFCSDSNEIIYVSTIHKAKGREFDNVFLMLDDFYPETDEAKRQLYVALTRAKGSLTIHYNGDYFDTVKTEDMYIVHDTAEYLPPNQLAMQLGYKDVWLDYFFSCQHLIARLNSGDMLTINEEGDGCLNSAGQTVIKFSRQFVNRIETTKLNHYEPQTARVRFIVYWQKEDCEHEVLIVLPELYFTRV